MVTVRLSVDEATGRASHVPDRFFAQPWKRTSRECSDIYIYMYVYNIYIYNIYIYNT